MVFVDGLLAYLAAYTGAFADVASLRPKVPATRAETERAQGLAGRDSAPLSARRLLFLLLFPLFIAFQIVNALCLALDHLFFPGFRRVAVRRPVFVLGVPRSGTTFLHRELARDARFNAPRTWELLLAPSLCQRFLISALARIDALLGSPTARLLAFLARRQIDSVSEVHPVAWQAAEEDYLALLACGGCFFMHLAFPSFRGFRDLSDLSRLDARRRERLLDHYHALLQRQLYFHSGGQLLSKNAVFASWAPWLARRYPDALILFCIREPAAALASQLNSLRDARRLFATFPEDRGLKDGFREHYRGWWQALAASVEELDPTPLVIEQEYLKHNRDAVMDLIYRRLQRHAAADNSASGCPGENGQAQSPAAAADYPTSRGSPQASAVAAWEIGENDVAPMLTAYGLLRSTAEHQREHGV